MKTIPTLCATATVVGTSSVGLAFGREAPLDSSHPNKKKATRAFEPRLDPMSTAAMTTTAPPYSAPIPVAPASRMSFATRLSQEGRSQLRIVRRKTSDDAAMQLPSSANNYYPSSEQSVSDLDTTRYVPTRRASWIKRLSSISNSSSRATSPSPLSPAVSCSNGSMAFSHDGSTVPVIDKRSTSAVPRNKLVKRSSSVRGPGEAPALGSSTFRPSFRRPATSHQRTATLHNYGARLSMTAEHTSTDEQQTSTSTDSEVEYTQFFTAKITKERTLARRRGSVAYANGFKRIFPDDKHKPMLVLARSVVASVEDTDDSTSDDADSVFLVSRPETPLSMAATFATKVTNQTRGRPSTSQAENAPRPKRSFSITSFLSSKKERTGAVPGPRLSRRATQRVNSAPILPTMSKRPHSTSYGEGRRDVTDPTPARRDIATSAGPADMAPARNVSRTRPVSSPLFPTFSSTDPVAGAALASMPQQPDVLASAAPGANQAPPSPTLAQSGVRASRHSMAPSEQASTLVGSSDNEVRALGSGDEDDADVQSETLFDSLRTGATRGSTVGARGPRIETIFDESPPSKVKITALRDLLPPGSFGEPTVNGVAGHQSIAEEEESISTPVRTVRPQRSLLESPSVTRTHSAPLFPKAISSSSPSMPKPLSLGTLEWDSRAGDDDDSSRWSLEEADDEDPWVDHPTVNHKANPVALLRQHTHLLAPGFTTNPTTPQHSTSEFGDKDARSSIFDWSEQQIADKNSGDRTPPRPRTVHGKKDADRRGSRSVGRRVPSGLHARSQSVPVVPDLTGKRNTVVTNKFGTWGVGSKGVTEDWNDDFDFSELTEEPVAEDGSSPGLDSGSAMIVPKSIQEQQNNVLANISLLREWGLLIEELKEQRVRAVALGMIQGAPSGMWLEVDAMIELADQEADHQDVAQDSPPSSPGFDEDAFEDPSASPSHGRGRRKSSSPHEDGTKNPPQSARPLRKSILPSNSGIFTPQSSPIPAKPEADATPVTQESKIIATRPRKDSEAKARSVIEALQKRRSAYEPFLDAPPIPSTPSKKVPFDTSTLRRIVPYVSTLTRKVKDTIRDAEGLYSSPLASPLHEEPPFGTIHQQEADLAAQMKLMTVM